MIFEFKFAPWFDVIEHKNFIFGNSANQIFPWILMRFQNDLFAFHTIYRKRIAEGKSANGIGYYGMEYEKIDQ